MPDNPYLSPSQARNSPHRRRSIVETAGIAGGCAFLVVVLLCLFIAGLILAALWIEFGDRYGGDLEATSVPAPRQDAARQIAKVVLVDDLRVPANEPGVRGGQCPPYGC